MFQFMTVVSCSIHHAHKEPDFFSVLGIRRLLLGPLKPSHLQVEQAQLPQPLLTWQWLQPNSVGGSPAGLNTIFQILSTG